MDIYEAVYLVCNVQVLRLKCPGSFFGVGKKTYDIEVVVRRWTFGNGRNRSFCPKMWISG